MPWTKGQRQHATRQPDATEPLEAAGVELLGGQVDQRGGGWRHFRAPDGNIYELTSG